MENKAPEKKSEREPVGGLLGGLLDFLEMLEDMDKKGLTEQTKRGEFTGPFGSRGRYEYTTRIGLGLKPRAGYRYIKPARIIGQSEIKEKEGLAEVSETQDKVVVTIVLPTVNEKDIELKISGNDLKITVTRPEGKIEKTIFVSKEGEVEKIERASFKNSVLEIVLKKKIASGKEHDE